MQPVIAATTAGNPVGPPPSKKVKNDVRAATLKFLSSANPIERSVVRVYDVLVENARVPFFPTGGLADHWELPTSREAIFAKFGMRVPVAIIKLSVQTEFRISHARWRWRGRKFANRPILTLRILEPKIVGRSQKLALGRRGCD